MGRAQREKGKRGEREAVQALQAIYPRAHRGWQSRDGSDAPDVDATPYWVEVKRGKRCNIKAALKQATEAAQAAQDTRPVLAWTREDGCQAIVSQWAVDRVRELEDVEGMRSELEEAARTIKALKEGKHDE